MRQGGSHLNEVLIFGATGCVGSYIFEYLRHNKLSVHGVSRSRSGGALHQAVSDSEIISILHAVRPECVVLCLGSPSVDEAERNPDISYAENVANPKHIINLILGFDSSIHIVCVSSIYVFSPVDGKSTFSESDNPVPASNYGRQKRELEVFVASSSSKGTIVRLPMVVGSYLHPNDFFNKALDRFRKGKRLDDDEGLRYPTDIRWIAENILLILERSMYGTFHLSSDVCISKRDLSLAFLRQGGCPVEDVEFERPASVWPRPRHLQITSEHQWIGVGRAFCVEDICARYRLNER